VSEADPISVKKQIALWKGRLEKAQALEQFGVKKKEEVKKSEVNAPKTVKKATKISKSSVRGESIVREEKSPAKERD